MRPTEGSHEIGGNWLSPDEYLDRMVNFKSWCFRFQVYQMYGIPREQKAFQEFMERGTYEVAPDDPALELTRQRMSDGRSLERVQVVHQPVSDYLRHAFVFFDHSAKAGEDLRILDTSRKSADGLPDYDFVLLDDETVIKLHYSNEDGSVVGREVLPDVDLDKYRRYRDYAMTNSIPFVEYERP